MGTSKKRFIELHGEEAWLKHLEKERERNREQFQKHKAKRIAKHKEYRDLHKEQCIGYSKKYRETHEETVRASCKSFYDKHRDEILASKREKYQDNIESERERVRRYNNSKKGRTTRLIGYYSRHDKENNRGETTLSKQWFEDNILNASCVYCGDSDWRHLGADRIDNSLPHTEDNCVCACGICNIERQWKRMSVEEFKEYRKQHPRDIDLKNTRNRI